MTCLLPDLGTQGNRCPARQYLQRLKVRHARSSRSIISFSCLWHLLYVQALDNMILIDFLTFCLMLAWRPSFSDMFGSMWKSRWCMRLLLKNDIVFISPSIIFHHHARNSNLLDSTSTNMGRFYIFGTQIQPLRSHWLIILSYISFIYLTTTIATFLKMILCPYHPVCVY